MLLSFFYLPGEIISPGGCCNTRTRPSKCFRVILKPHNASFIPIVCVIYKSFCDLVNCSCSFNCKTTIRLPVSWLGFCSKNKGLV